MSILGIVANVVLGGAGAGALSVVAWLPPAFPDIVTAGTEFSGAEELLASALHVPIWFMSEANDLANNASNCLASSSFCFCMSRLDAAMAAWTSVAENVCSSDALALREREGLEGDSAVAVSGGAV